MAGKKIKGTRRPKERHPAPATSPKEGAARAADAALPNGRPVVLTALAFALVVGAALWFARGSSEREGLPVTAALASKAALEPALATPASYIGVGACGGCHPRQQAAWHGSDHDLAMQLANAKSMLGNFENARFSYAGTTSTFFRRGDRFMVNTDGPDGKLADYEIKYAFGVRPLQQYLIEMPGGRIQALGIAWDARPKGAGGQRWFHLYPGQNIRAGDPLHWTGINQNWNFQCAECHLTNLRKNFDVQSKTFKTTWSEINVSCEACHGPGSNHVAWAGKREGHAQDVSEGLAIALDERNGITWMPVAETGNANRSAPRVTSREIDTCGRCHARSSRISDDYVHGKPPLDSHRLALLDDNLYWNDGQMRDEVYNWGSFVQSRMFANGVTCSDCHEPHSLKLRATGNAVCAQCHQPVKYDTARHTHHSEGTPASACTACHMATTTYMVVDARHDHSMRIPRPDVSALVGSPNACNNCHATETKQWAAEAIRRWTGNEPSSFQTFAAALRAGSTGAPGARAVLIAVIGDASQPAIARASAIRRLGRMLAPSARDVMMKALRDNDPIVRLAAVEALSHVEPALRPGALAPMLNDPVLAVRIEAARALAGASERGLSDSARAAFTIALEEYVAAQIYNADRPEARVNLGNLYAERGDPDAAVAQYRAALVLDASFVPGYVNLADLYRARDMEPEAGTTLRDGIARNPRAADLHFALGLALVRQKQSAAGLKELQAAAKISPGEAHFAYAYALALDDANQGRAAIDVLTTAAQRDPNDQELLSGLAYLEAKSGDREKALVYVAKLRQLDPENPQYLQMAQEFAVPR